ncbi:hypothetical protein EV182_008147, partial [Spiromyces aspiralis]
MSSDKTSKTLTSSRLPGTRDWKFYAAIAVPAIAAVGLSLWYLSSSSQARSKKKKRHASKLHKSMKGDVVTTPAPSDAKDSTKQSDILEATGE